MTQCKRCQGTIELRDYRHVTNVDGQEVGDSSRPVAQCNTCGHFRLTLGDVERYERRAAALVLRSLQTASGGVARYARRALGLTQEQLASLIGYAAQTISRVENERLDVDRSYQLSLVALLDTAIEFALDADGLLGFMRADVTAFEIPATHALVPSRQPVASVPIRKAPRVSGNWTLRGDEIDRLIATNDNGIIVGKATFEEAA